MARVRAGEGPGLIHARVTRPYSHSSADAQTKYRGSDELADEAVHDPIDVFETDLIAAGSSTPKLLRRSAPPRDKRRRSRPKRHWRHDVLTRPP